VSEITLKLEPTKLINHPQNKETLKLWRWVGGRGWGVLNRTRGG